MTCWYNNHKPIHSAAVITITFLFNFPKGSRSVSSWKRLRLVGTHIITKNRPQNSLYSDYTNPNHQVFPMVRRSPRLNPLGISTRTILTAIPQDGELPSLKSNGASKVATKRKTAVRRKSSSTNIHNQEGSSKRTRGPATGSTASKNSKKKEKSDRVVECLPRTREMAIQEEASSILHVMGIDEAGRGPLAGPVVAAAAIIPSNISGITDSKQIKKEEERERLYDLILASSHAQWAICVVDAPRIDEINILQATLQAMRTASCGIISTPSLRKEGGERVEEASAMVKGCYVVCGRNDSMGNSISLDNNGDPTIVPDLNDPGVTSKHYALIDGNRLPKEMPCEAETMVKGDSREYSIAAASILAKVTRDRIMKEYDNIYPQYELARHKGYPTAVHMKKVYEFGASPIHRRTFAPLKHMSFDKDGNILSNS